MTSILIVANSTHGGGAENTMMLLHAELRSRGYKTSFAALNAMDDEFEIYEKSVFQFGRRWSDGLSQTLACRKKFKATIQSLDPDVLLVNCELPELFVASIRLSKSKLVIVEHTTKPWDGRRPLGVLIRLLLKMRGASWVTVNSQENGIWPFGQSAVYIPNPVTPVSKGAPITKEKSVVFVGRLRKEKCPELVLQACLDTSTYVSLIGEGNLSSELRAGYSHSKYVEFLGYLQSPWARISPHSLVVVSSEYEGDGLVVLEALQNGNPILLRDIPDLRRFNLNNDNYFRDQAHLIEKLNAFRENPRLFSIPFPERDRILRIRDLRVITDQWIKLIDDLAEGEG